LLDRGRRRHRRRRHQRRPLGRVHARRSGKVDRHHPALLERPARSDHPARGQGLQLARDHRRLPPVRMDEGFSAGLRREQGAEGKGPGEVRPRTEKTSGGNRRMQRALYYFLAALAFASPARAETVKPAEWEKIVEAAKREGTVVASIPPNAELRKALEE